jgi:hypothetical protein
MRTLAQKRVIDHFQDMSGFPFEIYSRLLPRNQALIPAIAIKKLPTWDQQRGLSAIGAGPKCGEDKRWRKRTIKNEPFVLSTSGCNHTRHHDWRCWKSQISAIAESHIAEAGSQDQLILRISTPWLAFQSL